MDDFREKINAEREYIEHVLKYLKDAVERNDKSVIELTAIGAFLQNIYNGIEKILKVLLKNSGVEIPQSPTWHKDLLKASLVNGIISDDISDELFRYLSFRHFFNHSYGFMIEEEEISGLALDINKVWAVFISEIEVYCREKQ